MDGLNGKLVPERNPDELAKALELVISDPALRIEMGRKGNEIVRRDFSFYRGMKELAHRFGVEDQPDQVRGGQDGIITQPAAQ